MERLEETFKAACANGDIPGAVLASTNTTGSFTYTNSFGVRSLEDGDDTPIDENTLLTLTSCTKIVTAIAVMQIVEKGLIGLDDKIDEVLPELAALKILTAMDDGKPTFEERKNPMTLR
jgi:CubicO group peptidase (beta-lactamase class C family)